MVQQTNDDWIEALVESGPGCWNVQQPLYDRVRALPEAERKEGLLRLVADVAALVLEPTDRVPLRPRVPSIQRPVDEITSDELDELERIVNRAPADLRARIHDVVWAHRRGEELGHAVVRAYCDAARELAHGGVDVLDTPASRLERAQHVARMMRWREGDDETRALLLELLRDPSLRPEHHLGLAEIASAFGPSVATEAAELIEGIGTLALAANERREAADWDWARRALQVAADAFVAAGDLEKARLVRLRRAESFLQHAAWLEARPGTTGFMRAALVEDAVHAFRRANADRDVIEAAVRQLRAVQKASTAEFKTVLSETIDIREEATAAIRAVSGKSFRDALHALVRLHRPPPVQGLREHAAEAASTFVVQFLIPVRRIDAEGRTVATQSVAIDDRSDAALRPSMLEHAALTRKLAVEALIIPAVQRIALEHSATFSEWTAVLEDCHLVQPARAQSLATGLRAGLHFDQLVAVPVLVPQLEHLLRLIVLSRGGITVAMAEDSTQKEVMISSLLAKKELADALGADWVFDLTALLVDAGTGNLRNTIAHGMLDDRGIYGVDGFYLWYTVLRMLLLMRMSKLEPDGVPDTTA